MARHERRQLVQAGRATTAKQAVQGLSKGCWISGLTMGQFSLIDLITAIVERIGPADVRLSTWTTGIKDMETAIALLDTGRFKSLQILTDRSFPSRQPAYAARLVQLFGADAVVCTQVHAKVAVLRAPGWAVTVRSSMNLNRNDRFEQFDLDEGAALADFYAAWFDLLRKEAGTGIDFQHADQAAAYEAALRAPLTDEAVVLDMMSREGVEPPTPTQAAKRDRKAGRAEEAAPDVLSLDLFDLDPVSLARANVAIAQHGLRSAEPSSVAYVQGHRALREVLAEAKDIRTAQQRQSDPVTVGTAEWLARSAEDATTCSEDELEVYVSEWLRRRSLSLVHEVSGRLALVQVAG